MFHPSDGHAKLCIGLATVVTSTRTNFKAVTKLFWKSGTYTVAMHAHKCASLEVGLKNLVHILHLPTIHRTEIEAGIAQPRSLPKQEENFNDYLDLDWWAV